MQTREHKASIGDVNKLRYIKEWVQQSHLTTKALVGSATLNFAAVTLTVGHWQNPTVAAGLASLIAVSTVTTVMLTVFGEKSIVKDYKSIFASDKQCKDVVTRAAILYKDLFGSYGEKVLRNGLHRLSMNVLHSIAGKRPCVTELGEELVGYKLPSANATCLEIVMRETLYEYMEDHSFSFAYLASKGTDKELPPPQVQQFIAKNFPELVARHPELYVAEHLDSSQPGLHVVVQNLLALSASQEEMYEHVRNWLSSQNTVNGSTPFVSPSLPSDLLSFT